MSTDKKITNPKMVDLMKKLRTEYSLDIEKLFLTEINNSKFLVPILPSESGDSRDIQIFDLQNDGKRYIPLFTDWDEINDSKIVHNVDGLVVTYADICAMLDSGNWQAVVLNPDNQNIIINSKEFKNINSSNSDENVYIGEPANYPYELTKKLEEKFLETKTVKMAYLAQISSNNNLSILLVLDSRDLNKDLANINEIMSTNTITLDYPLDVIPLNTELGQQVSEIIKPFFNTSTH